MPVNSITFKNKNQKIVLLEQYNNALFKQNLMRIDDCFVKGNAELLKDGDTTTVAKVIWGNKPFIIKRYNNMGFLHTIKRLFLSRAKRVWRCAHRLLAYGINTAKPIAYVEEGNGKNKKSFIITEYIEGISAWHFFENETAISEKNVNAASAIINLINQLFRMPVSHGDLKAFNIILNDDKAYFIDLDGTRLHWSNIQRSYRQRRDKKRFLKNWIDRPELYNYFAERIYLK